MIPVLAEPPGDPAGIRLAAERLSSAVVEVAAVAKQMAVVDEQVATVWSSQAQKVYSSLSSLFEEVISGSSRVASSFTAALRRHATILEGCLAEIRDCRLRIDDLVAATPPGVAPNPAVLNGLLARANDAYQRARVSAQELSSTATALIGGAGDSSASLTGGSAQATFVSHAHSAGLASTHPSAGAFDAQSAQIQAQLNGVMSNMLGLVTGNGFSSPFTVDPAAIATHGQSSVMVDPKMLAPTMLTFPVTPTSGQLVATYPGSDPSALPENLVMVAPPYSTHGTGTSLAILVDTSVRANPANPALAMSQQDSAYELAMISINQPMNPQLELFVEDPGPFETWSANNRIDLDRDFDSHNPND